MNGNSFPLEKKKYLKRILNYRMLFDLKIGNENIISNIKINKSFIRLILSMENIRKKTLEIICHCKRIHNQISFEKGNVQSLTNYTQWYMYYKYIY